MHRLNVLKLLLPALIPSWNFFDIITASPRVQYTLLKNKDDKAKQWTEFRPRPQKLSIQQNLLRLFYNANWNESLFLVSCAERIMLNASAQQVSHSENEILHRISREIQQNEKATATAYLQFRLLYISRQENELIEEITYLSRRQRLLSANEA